MRVIHQILADDRVPVQLGADNDMTYFEFLLHHGICALLNKVAERHLPTHQAVTRTNTNSRPLMWLSEIEGKPSVSDDHPQDRQKQAVPPLVGAVARLDVEYPLAHFVVDVDRFVVFDHYLGARHLTCSIALTSASTHVGRCLTCHPGTVTPQVDTKV